MEISYCHQTTNMFLDDRSTQKCISIRPRPYCKKKNLEHLLLGLNTKNRSSVATVLLGSA